MAKVSSVLNAAFSGINPASSLSSQSFGHLAAEAVGRTTERPSKLIRHWSSQVRVGGVLTGSLYLMTHVKLIRHWSSQVRVGGVMTGSLYLMTHGKTCAPLFLGTETGFCSTKHKQWSQTLVYKENKTYAHM